MSRIELSSATTPDVPLAELPISALVEFPPGHFGVRLRASHARQAAQAIHLVPIPNTDVIPEYLRARCGLVIRRGEAEQVRVFSGMPCVLCVAGAFVTATPPP